MKSEKDIIDDIISRLKEQPDRGYREGAWESFKRQNPSSTNKISPITRWVSAAAALLLLGVGGVYYIKNSTTPNIDNGNNIAAVVENKDTAMDSQRADQSEKRVPNERSKIDDNELRSYSRISPQSQEAEYKLNLPVISQAFSRPEISLEIPPQGSIKKVLAETRSYTSADIRTSQSTPAQADHSILAARSIPTSELSFKEVESINQKKQVHFGDRFDLGLFVSPQSTSQKTNVGGGLTLAYNITNKVSVRTGASYNSYEVGMMKNPAAASSAEAVVVRQKASDAPVSNNIMAYSATESNRMIIPNVNAVTSIVQSLDVPLEVKYNVAKSFYAVAGVSYSAILNQERNAHYVDNINTETFSQGFPEDEKQMKSAVKAVSKTIKSADENVSTNGFNGFVNFSIGKKVKVNNRFGISVEPYFKVPVGQYRRSDMDYTNGGIRVMTNF
ncbi:hypothetical protein [Sphingobacterium faecale]|uniref:Outer membrane beta-barrel protein n=1 Tax=Sphingobacterium faecale TaxID=2803775 RepID=A0ABS1R365_9SPHI|nr:hypothetical protein [Sphingobacterium faecale]MBL1409138.1 hypothetical protein [Sphingobacterium faecale]